MPKLTAVETLDLTDIGPWLRLSALAILSRRINKSCSYDHQKVIQQL